MTATRKLRRKPRRMHTSVRLSRWHTLNDGYTFHEMINGPYWLQRSRYRSPGWRPAHERAHR